MTAPAPESTVPEGTSPADNDYDDASAQEALAAAAREAEGADDGDDDDDDLDPKVKAKIERANREAKNLRERIKQLQPLAEEAKKRADAEKSESQKLAEAKAALEVELSELRVANVRREAAEAAGLAPKFVKFITAADADEALAQAKELAKAVQPEAAATPRPADLRQGTRGSSKPPQMSADDYIRGLAGR